MNEIKNLSRKSARPAMIATKNQKQTISLTIVSTEGGIYNKVLFKVYQKVFVVYRCMKNESNVKRDVIYVIYLDYYVLYIVIVIYLDP